jgi:hypothetical protein
MIPTRLKPRRRTRILDASMRLARSFPHRHSALIVSLVFAGLGLAFVVSADPPKGTGAIEARILALGVPIPGVAVQVRSTGDPGGEQWIEDPKAVVDTSDARGMVRFTGLAAGRYHVVGHCGRLPGDHIAGNIATKAEVLPGKTAHATLTLRRGGRILGRAMEGDRGMSGVTLLTEANSALQSSCPMLEPRNPGPDGRFTVGKVPLGTAVSVKALRRLGKGDLEVWKDFNLAAAETVSGTWTFPELDSAQLGTVTIGVRLDDGRPADRGRLEIQHIDEGWRYRLGFDFTEADSLTVLPDMPAGEYSIRAMATPGGKSWWNATTDTIVVAQGARHRKIIPARLRQAAASPAPAAGHEH